MTRKYYAPGPKQYAATARRYERRAKSYYDVGMTNAGDRALGSANFYWDLAGASQMKRVYPGTCPMTWGPPKENPMKKTIRRGRSNAVIDRNINAFMKLGYSYPAAVRAAKALTGPNAVAENPLSVTWVWGLGAAVALGVGYLFFAKPAAAASTPAPSGSVPITTNASGFPVIVLTPGNMGGLTTMSTATDSGGQQINLQAPPGGAILNVVSSNTNVLFGMSGSPTTSGLALGTPNLPGTTTITVSWTLGGAPQTSTFTITAS